MRPEIWTNEKRAFFLLRSCSMSSILALRQYDSNSDGSTDSDDNVDETNVHLRPLDKTSTISSQMVVVAAPDVVSKVRYVSRIFALFLKIATTGHVLASLSPILLFINFFLCLHYQSCWYIPQVLF